MLSYWLLYCSHLAFNSIALWSFGNDAASALGVNQFLAFYVTAGLSSALLSDLGRVRSLTGGISLGASGAVYACFALTAMLKPDAQVSYLILFLAIFLGIFGHDMIAYEICDSFVTDICVGHPASAHNLLRCTSHNWTGWAHYASNLINLNACERHCVPWSVLLKKLWLLVLRWKFIVQWHSMFDKCLVRDIQPGVLETHMRLFTHKCSAMIQVVLIILPWFPINIADALNIAIAADLAGVILGWRRFDHFGHLGGSVTYSQFINPYKLFLLNVLAPWAVSDCHTAIGNHALFCHNYYAVVYGAYYASIQLHWTGFHQFKIYMPLSRGTCIYLYYIGFSTRYVL